VNLAEGKVSFQARDNTRPGHQRPVTITAPEFIRRFLLHVLPPQFVKIRHYGLMAPSNVNTKLEKARALVSLKASGAMNEPKGQKLDSRRQTKTWQEMLQGLTGLDLTACPNCGQGKLIRRRLIASEATTPAPAYGILHELRLLAKPHAFNSECLAEYDRDNVRPKFRLSDSSPGLKISLTPRLIQASGP
jgi:hypothetical protein